MALRPVFVATDSCPFVIEQPVDFKYYSGFALSQQQKSIQSLHEAFHKLPNCDKINTLEVSSKSTERIGNLLSAFNLVYRLKNGDYCPLECVFQAGKVFEDMTQFVDIMEKTPREAKHDTRLREHGGIIQFKLGDDVFSTEPKTYFYDWIYCNALHQNTGLTNELLRYGAFTDIAFNPQKSLNCQARSAAKYVGLTQAGLLETALRSKEDFLRIAYKNVETVVEQVQLRMGLLDQ